MKQFFLAILLVGPTLLFLAGKADADSGHGSVETSPGQGGFTVGLTHQFGGTGSLDASDSSSSTDNAGSIGNAAPTIDLGTVLFDGFCAGTNYTSACDPPPANVPGSLPAISPAVTPGVVLAALRRIELPASELQVQPPNGETLVNFDTNFFTRQGEFTRTVTLLGQRVELRIWPSQYRWVFGDGGSLASESAGAPYPDLQITHDYRSKGGVRPRVDTTYSARFRVNGGAWRDVDGTVTIPGAPVDLQVRTATPVLVGHN